MPSQWFVLLLFAAGQFPFHMAQDAKIPGEEGLEDSQSRNFKCKFKNTWTKQFCSCKMRTQILHLPGPALISF